MKRDKISVLDYGMGNVLSVIRAFEKVGHTVDLVSTPVEVLSSQALVIPGVGAFPNAMANLIQKDLVDPIKSVGQAGKSVIGICLGMQLLFEYGHEFTKTEGLGLIKGEVHPISNVDIEGRVLKVPHVGWNSLIFKPDFIHNKLNSHSVKRDEFYFVHSLHAKASNGQDVLAVTNYGGYELAAITESSNFLGFQFHPEKSGKKGLELIEKIKLE
jgi:glutamine amidotransferase